MTGIGSAAGIAAPMTTGLVRNTGPSICIAFVPLPVQLIVFGLLLMFGVNPDKR